MAPTYAQRDYPPIPDIERVGVIGAGQMGGGIAQIAAQAGYQVRLLDVSPQALEGALGRIDYFLGRAVQKGQVTEGAKKEALSRITTGTSNEVVSDCELVIEAAIENEEVKRKIFQGLLP